MPPSITFPGSLPQSPQSVEIERVDNRLRTTMETGPAKVRRRFTAVPTVYRCTNTLTPTEYHAFHSFYVDTTSDGTEEFNYPTITGTSGYETFRFLDVPKYQTTTDTCWKVNFALEQMP